MFKSFIMKKNIFSAIIFVMALSAAFAFTPLKPEAKGTFTNGTAYYNNSGQSNCPNSKTCSDVNNLTNCVAGVSSYFESNCSTASIYKWRP